MKVCTTLFQKKHASQDERRNYQQKKVIQSKKKNDSEGQETFAFSILLILKRFLSAE